MVLLQTVKLNFTFFFYGHEVDSVTLATGGNGFMFLLELGWAEGLERCLCGCIVGSEA